MGVEVLFLGTGDAFGCGGRLPTATLLTAGDTRVLVDCGPATLPALRGHGVAPADVETILLTHLHGDHFGGVPFFLMDAHYASRRTAPLTIAGPAGIERRIADAQEALFAGNGRLPVSFPLTWVEWSPREAAAIGGAEATPIPVAHSSELPCFGLRVAVGGRTVAFSGDTEWTEALIELADGADLFVCECYGFDWAPPKHLDYQTLLRERDRLRSSRIYLTHLGTDMLARAGSLAWPIAADGLRLTLQGSL